MDFPRHEDRDPASVFRLGVFERKGEVCVNEKRPLKFHSIGELVADQANPSETKRGIFYGARKAEVVEKPLFSGNYETGLVAPTGFEPVFQP